MMSRRNKDLENLQRLQKNGLIKDLSGLHYYYCDAHPLVISFVSVVSMPLTLDVLADWLPEWRVERGEQELLLLAYYGDNDDLDGLVKDDNPRVRAAVAFRRRAKDLDRLAYDSSPWVKGAVAIQRIDKYLDLLIDDFNWEVRSTVASHGRPQDLIKLADDPSWAVQEMLQLGQNM